MDDEALIGRIEQLIHEEHRLRGREHTEEPLGAAERARLEDLEVRLDQCWDLLRRRRAGRSIGVDPEEVEVRGPDVVEHYQQ